MNEILFILKQILSIQSMKQLHLIFDSKKESLNVLYLNNKKIENLNEINNINANTFNGVLKDIINSNEKEKIIVEYDDELI